MASCCGGNTEDSKRSKVISKELAAEKKKVGQIIKLLLLGAGDSGKSTIAKQMKIIHLEGFNEEEKKSYKTAIANNILTAIRTLIHQCTKFNYTLAKANEPIAQKILDIPRDQDPVITPELGEYILALWHDSAIKDTFQRSNEYQLNDSTSYYFDNLTRIGQPSYLPTEQDVLRSRVKTTGVLETTFNIQDFEFRLVDVGGQRSERRKWIHCFDEVTAIIFCVAISEYDLKLYEDNETNRMFESLQLFRELCSTKWFSQTSFILFLNKTDIFEEKIKRVPLSVCFPAYAPVGSDVVESDTKNIEVVFNATRDIILSKTLTKIGVM